MTYGILKSLATCKGKNDEYPPVDITSLGLCFLKKSATIKNPIKILIKTLVLLKIELIEILLFETLFHFLESLV